MGEENIPSQHLQGCRPHSVLTPRLNIQNIEHTYSSDYSYGSGLGSSSEYDTGYVSDYGSPKQIEGDMEIEAENSQDYGSPLEKMIACRTPGYSEEQRETINHCIFM